MRKKLPLFGIRIRLLRIPQFAPLRLAVTHYIYNREFSSIFQCAASAVAARCVSLCSTLRRSSQRAGFSASMVLCFLAAVSFCPRSLFPLSFLPDEISVPRLRMAVQSLLMCIQRLRMCIQRLQTEILASSFRNVIWLCGKVWAAG